MFIVEHFLSGIVRDHEKQPVSTDGRSWYPLARQFLKLKHHTHSPDEKSIMRGPFSISRTELKFSMTIFLAKEKRNAN
jgi:hypothetical protein